MKKNGYIVPKHATPIDDISGLRIKGITTYRELSAQEMESILVAKGKYFIEMRRKTSSFRWRI